MQNIRIRIYIVVNNCQSVLKASIWYDWKSIMLYIYIYSSIIIITLRHPIMYSRVIHAIGITAFVMYLLLHMNYFVT